MPDMTAISALLSSIKAALDIAQGIRSADVSLEKAELKLKLADLISTLADTKISISEINALLEEKEQQIASLKDALSLKAILVRKGDAYFETDKNGQPKGDPYCSCCWETEHRAIHLYVSPTYPSLKECPRCKNETKR